MLRRSGSAKGAMLGGSPKAVYKGRLIYRRYMAIGLFIIIGLYGALQLEQSDFFGLGRRVWTVLLAVEFGVLIVMMAQDLTFRVRSYRDGLVVGRLGQRKVVRWDDIADARYTVARARGRGPVILRRHTLRLDDGSRLVLDDRLGDVRSLGETIRRETVRRLLPPLVERVDAGETVNFGELSISPEGIRGGDRLIRWHQVSGVRVDEDDGLIAILSKKQGGGEVWGAVSIAGTPNPFVFAELIRRFARDKR